VTEPRDIVERLEKKSEELSRYCWFAANETIAKEFVGLFDESKAEITRIRTELALAETIMDKLPRTADGVPLIPQANGNLVWWCDQFGNAYWNRNVVQGGDGLWYGHIGWMVDFPRNSRNEDPDYNRCRPLSECYSTREAAEAARGAK